MLEGHYARLSRYQSWSPVFKLRRDGEVLSLATATEITVVISSFDSNSPLISLTMTSGRVVRADDNLSFSFTVKRSEFSALEPETYRFQSHVTFTSDTDEAQVANGTITLIEGAR